VAAGLAQERLPILVERFRAEVLDREGDNVLENKVRNLHPGMAYLISRGKAMKVHVPRAPALHTSLPVRASQTPSQDAPEPRNSVVDLPF
jgi:hypothetical protein